MKKVLLIIIILYCSTASHAFTFFPGTTPDQTAKEKTEMISERIVFAGDQRVKMNNILFEYYKGADDLNKSQTSAESKSTRLKALKTYRDKNIEAMLSAEQKNKLKGILKILEEK